MLEPSILQDSMSWRAHADVRPGVLQGDQGVSVIGGTSLATPNPRSNVTGVLQDSSGTQNLTSWDPATGVGTPNGWNFVQAFGQSREGDD